MQENEEAKAARRALENHLESGEQLLAVSKGSVARLRSHWYYVGLTDSRFILQPLRRGKPSAEVYSIWRAGIKPPRWRRGFRHTLVFALPKDTLTLHFGTLFRLRGRHWQAQAANMADLARKQPPNLTDAAVLARRRLQQAQDYQKLDFPRSGQSELALASTDATDLITDPATASSAKALRRQLAEDLLALRVGGGFFFGGIVVDLLFIAALVYIVGDQVLESVFGIDLLFAWALSIWAGTSLLRGRTGWRPWAIFVAALALLIYGFVNLFNLYIIDLVSQLGYSGAIVVALTGRSTRARTVIAAVIYLGAYIGTTLYQLSYLLFQVR